MAEDLVMPRLSDSMEEGTILKWLKAVGDEVGVGDELVEIETDKANMVYEADAAGTLIEIVAEEGDTLPIGEVIARVGEAGEAPGGGNGGAPQQKPDEKTPSLEEKLEARRASTQATATAAEPEAGGRTGAGGRPRETGGSRRPPSPDGSPARRAWTSRALQGSGPGGRIVKADVEKAAQGETRTADAGARPAPPLSAAGRAGSGAAAGWC